MMTKITAVLMVEQTKMWGIRRFYAIPGLLSVSGGDGKGGDEERGTTKSLSKREQRMRRRHH